MRDSTRTHTAGQELSQGRDDYAVVRLNWDRGDFPQDWQPKSPRSLPPATLSGYPEELVKVFVLAFNDSEEAAQKNRTAYLLESRNGFIRCSADPFAEEDNAPEMGLTQAEARAKAQELNTPIIEAARVPRYWYVPVIVAEADNGRRK